MMTGPVTPAAIAASIDLTLLEADATADELRQRCAEAVKHGFASVCVHTFRVEQARCWLEDSPVKVAAAVGFPLGASLADVKRFETEAAIDEGAQEIDVVLNLARLKDGDDAGVLRELRDIVEAADERPVKVAMEAGLLVREQIVRACRLVLESGARFVATSTGFPPGVVSAETVRLLRETAGPELGIKAAGMIADAKVAAELMEAGATRLGTRNGVGLVHIKG